MTDGLYLIRTPLDSAGLFRLSGRPAVARQATDLGYVVHSALGELFGSMAPKPFALDRSTGRHLHILGYSAHAPEALAARAENAGLPLADLVDWRGFSGKRMPDVFPSGHRLTFCVRVCPVIRKSGAGPHIAAGAEIDVFLAAVERAGPDTRLDRQGVYREWFLAEIARRGGMRCGELRISAMRRVRLSRRGGPERHPAALERPDVTLEGRLEVTDPVLFRAAVARGLGRHRSFGFGMLLLRAG